MPESDEHCWTILVVAVPGRIARVTQALLSTMPEVVAVTTADCGATALAVLKAATADLVIWDAAALGCGGWSILAEAKHRWPSLPAIVLAVEPADEMPAINAGADAVLRRHYHIDSLLTIVARLLAPAG
jgi:DNA-binding response OmpR family regulator